MRDVVIKLRARPEQQELISRAARLLGNTRSDFTLEAACERAQAVLLDQEFFALDAARFRQFRQLLETPPARNPGLERLKAIESPWSAKTGKR